MRGKCFKDTCGRFNISSICIRRPLRIRHCVFVNGGVLDIWKALCINSPLFMHHAAVIIWNDVKCGQTFCRKLQPARKMLVDTNRGLWNEKLMASADVLELSGKQLRLVYNRGLFISAVVIRSARGFTEEQDSSYRFIWEYIRPEMSIGESIKGKYPSQCATQCKISLIKMESAFVVISVDFILFFLQKIK